MTSELGSKWYERKGKVSVRRGPRAGKIFCVGDTSFENYCKYRG